jgi:glutamate/tyrosine decarboxylase-like PLP-dependent enzyme
MNDLLHSTAERAARYLLTAGERPVAPSQAARDRLAELGGPLPDGPSEPAEVLAMLDELGSPATMATAGPRYFGFVIGGTLPAALAANWLASAWDQDAGSETTSPTAAHLEDVALNWLLDLLKLPTGCGAGFVTGATMANFSALAAARHAELERAGWDVEADGLFGAPPVTVVVGDEAHSSVLKALGLLGFGRERVVRVPVDAQGRVQLDALPPVAGPTIICTQVGNVNTGACDPVGEICERVRPAGAWVHVDGAFGLWAAASPIYEHLVHGVEQADSWATDAHKWLNVPYDSGIAFVRDPEPLRLAMAATAAYLPTSATRQPDAYTPELSRRARGVDIWAALRSLGRGGVAELVERCCRHARHFAEGLQAAGYEVLNEVVLNQVLVAFGDDETTRRVITELQDDGTCWCGGTVWQGRAAMRISVSNWSTTDSDVERSLEAMLRVAAG